MVMYFAATDLASFGTATFGGFLLASTTAPGGVFGTVSCAVFPK